MVTLFSNHHKNSEGALNLIWMQKSGINNHQQDAFHFFQFTVSAMNGVEKDYVADRGFHDRRLAIGLQFWKAIGALFCENYKLVAIWWGASYVRSSIGQQEYVPDSLPQCSSVLFNALIFYTS